MNYDDVVVLEGSIAFGGSGRTLQETYGASGYAGSADGGAGRRETGFMRQGGTDPAGHFRRNSLA